MSCTFLFLYVKSTATIVDRLPLQRIPGKCKALETISRLFKFYFFNVQSSVALTIIVRGLDFRLFLTLAFFCNCVTLRRGFAQRLRGLYLLQRRRRMPSIAWWRADCRPFPPSVPA
jgi:hypothetical protein